MTDSDKFNVPILQVHGNMSRAHNDSLSERMRECFDLGILTFPFCVLTSNSQASVSYSFQ